MSKLFGQSDPDEADPLHFVQWADAKYADPIREAHKLFPLLGKGRHRCTFDLGNGWVLKLPHTFSGEDANKGEVRRAAKEPRVSPCNLVEFMGIVCVEMMKVEVVPTHIDIPTWARNVDMQQVGYLPTLEKVVVYDFGDGWMDEDASSIAA